MGIAGMRCAARHRPLMRLLPVFFGATIIKDAPVRGD